MNRKESSWTALSGAIALLSAAILAPALAAPPATDKSFDLGGTSPGSACGGSVHCVSSGQSIQAAIDAANSGDTIQVSVGTYNENLDISSKAVNLLGGFPAGNFSTRNPLANPTILNGGGTGSVLYFLRSTPSVVDGFRIRNGSGFVDAQNYFPGQGGGIFAKGSDVQISNNIIENNDTLSTCLDDSSCHGGGIYIEAAFDFPAKSAIFGNIIRNNVGSRAGGIFIAEGEAVIRDNLVENNVGVSDHGGGIGACGDIDILRNIVINNSIGRDVGYGWGGGIFVFEDCGFVHLEHNRIVANSAPTIGSGVFFDEGVSGDMNGDLVYDNNCADLGSGVFVDGSYDNRGSTVQINNVTVAGHDCPGTGNAIYVEGLSTANVTNSIFHDNGANETYVDNNSTLSIDYTIVNGYPGTGNFDGDPAFVDSGNQDFHLRASSPGIDAADPTSPINNEPAPNGGRRNLGSYGGTSQATTTCSGNLLVLGNMTIPAGQKLVCEANTITILNSLIVEPNAEAEIGFLNTLSFNPNFSLPMGAILDIAVQAP